MAVKLRNRVTPLVQAYTTDCGRD